jgi:hypothetical protein
MSSIFLAVADSFAATSLRIVFPIPAIVLALSGSVLWPLAVLLAVLQIPVYVSLVLRAIVAKRPRALVIAAVAHVAAMVLCLAGFLPESVPIGNR